MVFESRLRSLLLSAVVSGTPVLSSGATSLSGVGTYTITVDLSGVKLNSGYSYVLGSTSATLTITPKALTASGSRVYDGTTGFAASLAGLSGLVGSDAVALSGVGTLADKNVGSGKAVSGLTLTGASAANYTLGGVSATVTAKELGWSVADSAATYGTLAAPGSATLGGVVAGDSVSAATGFFTTGGAAVSLAANTGAGGYLAKVTGLTGADAGNYRLSGSGASGALSIARAALAVTCPVGGQGRRRRRSAARLHRGHQLRHRQIAPDGLQRHLRLELCRVPLPLPRHRVRPS